MTLRENTRTNIHLILSLILSLKPSQLAHSPGDEATATSNTAGADPRAPKTQLVHSTKGVELQGERLQQ